jgi:hypothetical protein
VRLDADYEQWIVSSFSGVLCVDEVYQDKLAVLLAVDPAGTDGDRLVGYQLVHGAVNQQHAEDFLGRLAAAGVCPAQVVTDGSALYPAALARLWPQAAHQLCLFHETRHVVDAALAAIKSIAKAVPAPPSSSGAGGGRLRHRHQADGDHLLDRAARIRAVLELRHQHGMGIKAIARRSGHSVNTVRSWLRGSVRLPLELPPVRAQDVLDQADRDRGPSPSDPPQPWTTWRQVAETRALLRTGSYSLTARRENIGTQAAGVVDSLLRSPIGDDLRVVHDFTQSWYRIWWTRDGRRRTPAAARRRAKSLRADPRPRSIPPLRRIQEKLTNDHIVSVRRTAFPTSVTARAIRSGDGRRILRA